MKKLAIEEKEYVGLKVTQKACELRNLIYQELPMLLSEIVYGAFAMAESAPGSIIVPSDMKAIATYIDETKIIFNEVIQSKEDEMKRLTQINKDKIERAKELVRISNS